MAAVDWSTEKVVSGFALIGFSGVILECVACVSYVFFFIIFGIICLLAAVAWSVISVLILIFIINNAKISGHSHGRQQGSW